MFAGFCEYGNGFSGSAVKGKLSVERPCVRHDRLCSRNLTTRLRGNSCHSIAWDYEYTQQTGTNLPSPSWRPFSKKKQSLPKRDRDAKA